MTVYQTLFLMILKVEFPHIQHEGNPNAVKPRLLAAITSHKPPDCLQRHTYYFIRAVIKPIK